MVQAASKRWSDPAILLRALGWLGTLGFCAAGGLTVWGGQSVTLAWDPSPDTNVVGYFIYYGTSSGINSNRIDVGNSTNATVTGLTEGLVFYFVATAYNADGLESVPSNELAFLVPGIVKLSAPATRDCPASITFPVVQGRTYLLQASLDLQSWEDIWTTTGTTNDWVQFVDLPSRRAWRQRFYRLVLLQSAPAQ